jgi:hypothetical protein
MSNREALAAQLLADIDAELRAEYSKLEQQKRKVLRLESQRDAARILTGRGATATPQDGGGQQAALASVDSNQLVRAKNLKELVFQYLREKFPRGTKVPELYKLMVETSGVVVGRKTYLYHLLNLLQDDGLVRRLEDGRYIASAHSEAGDEKVL